MESPKSMVSHFNSSFAVSKQSYGSLSNGGGAGTDDKKSSFIGLLEVFVHQARDIQNICIYHKQDVYAKLCLTSDPETVVSTKTVNGGGRNPVFDDTVQLNVKTVDCSLKCEIYMMSRVKNYLEDQLLGFALVPLSEVIMKNGKLENEFSLTSTDLFHSPAGFVRLSVSYSGESPEVMAIAAPTPLADDTPKNARVIDDESLDEIEFLDPSIVNENHKMVSEYFERVVVASDVNEDHAGSEVGFPETNTDTIQTVSDKTVEAAPKHDSPKSSASNGVSSPSIAVSSGSPGAPVDSKTSEGEKETKESSLPNADDATVKPVLNVNIEPEQKVVQEQIVDMYMKSMQEFTESLAKMKLPLEVDSPTKSGDSSASSDQKLQTPKSAGSRVFYGSRAFF